MSAPVRQVLELLAVAARIYPDVAQFLASLSRGDSSAVDELARILPVESESAAVLRERQ